MTLIKIPKHYEYTNLGTSNFDYEIDEGFEEALRKKNVYGIHSAWNFNGAIWHEDGIFYEAIMRFRSHVETLRAKTLEEVIKKANDEFGYS